jgi:pyruvate kinase
MDRIIDNSDAVLIDRGDLFWEVPLEYGPFYQKAIVRRANCWSRPVCVATNLLESMLVSSRPTLAEGPTTSLTPCWTGVHRLVLAAETAIGHDLVGTVKMVARMIRAFEWSSFSTLLERDQPLVSAP